METSLAIVIPAFKGRFLPDTLNSLAGQTCGKFNVYIGDDASPDDLASIVEPYRQQLSLHYKKFETNLGKESLTAHWARVIDMVQDEKWIWLLPDDDMIGEDCVATFFNYAVENEERLYRFQTVHIDENNRLIKRMPLCPPLESNVEFIVRKLKFERSSTVAEYIFSKTAYEKAGGFVHLPLAWGSDDLMWMKLSYNHDIVTLPAGLVQLRQSSLNISNNKTAYTREKAEAKYLFLKKILNDQLFTKKMEGLFSLTEFKKEIATHLFFEYKSEGLNFTGSNLLRYARMNNELLGGGFFKNLYRLIRYQLKNAK